MAGRTVQDHAAATGSHWTCCRSQEFSAPSPFGVLCGRLCLTLAGEKLRHREKWPNTHRFPLGLAGLGEATWEKHLQLLLLDCFNLYKSKHTSTHARAHTHTHSDLTGCLQFRHFCRNCAFTFNFPILLQIFNQIISFALMEYIYCVQLRNQKH